MRWQAIWQQPIMDAACKNQDHQLCIQKPLVQQQVQQQLQSIKHPKLNLSRASDVQGLLSLLESADKPLCSDSAWPAAGIADGSLRLDVGH